MTLTVPYEDDAEAADEFAAFQSHEYSAFDFVRTAEDHDSTIKFREHPLKRNSVVCDACYRAYRKNATFDRRRQATNKELLAYVFQAVEEDKLKDISSQCRFWPYNRSRGGYAGSVRYNRERVLVARLVLHLAGRLDDLNAKLDAAHACRGAKNGCMNLVHLSAKTRKENAADRLRDNTHDRGERNPMAALTNKEVSEIRKLHAIGETITELAKEYDVSRSTISGVVHFKSYQPL
jgi:Helix-turn-helix domain of resolvase